MKLTWSMGTSPARKAQIGKEEGYGPSCWAVQDSPAIPGAACLPVDIQAWPSKTAPKFDVMLR